MLPLFVHHPLSNYFHLMHTKVPQTFTYYFKILEIHFITTLSTLLPRHCICYSDYSPSTISNNVHYDSSTRVGSRKMSSFCSTYMN